MTRLRRQIVETLHFLGAKKNLDSSLGLMSLGLLIRDKETFHEYTVEKVSFDDENPIVTCFRYYGPRGGKRAYLHLTPKDFDKYEAV